MKLNHRLFFFVLLELFAFFGSCAFSYAAPTPNQVTYRVVSMEGLQRTRWSHKDLLVQDSNSQDFTEIGSAGAIHTLARPFKLRFRKNSRTGRFEARAPSIEFKVDLQEENTATLTCTAGNCGDLPDVSDATADCGNRIDSSFWTIRYLLGHIFILPRGYGDFFLPEGFLDLITTQFSVPFVSSDTNIPAGTAVTLCGPHYPNTGIEGADDFRYPFGPDTFGSIVGTFNSRKADKLLLDPTRKKIKRVFQTSEHFQQNTLFNGSGTVIDGDTVMVWTIVMRRVG